MKNYEILPQFRQYSINEIKPEGWLLERLLTMKKGLTGYAEILYPDFLGSESEWLGGAFNWNTERTPYYLRGLISLAWLIDDDNLKEKAKKWIEWAINSRQADGSFGPVYQQNDWWWKYTIMLYALRDYYTSTGDGRIIDLVSGYLDYYADNIDKRPPVEWGKARPGDELEVAIWGWELSGNNKTLELCYKIIDLSYNIYDLFYTKGFLNYDFHTPQLDRYENNDWYVEHSVNVAQMIKFFSLAFRITGDKKYLNAYKEGLSGLLSDHGTVCNMFNGTEWLSGRGSTQGVELCAIVERMLSEEIHLFNTGDTSSADTIEYLAYNLFPGAMSAELTQLQYYTLPNQPYATRKHPGFLNPSQEWSDSIAPGPYSGFPCCSYNWHMGWPYFARSIWGKTDNNVAILLYAPSRLCTHINNCDVELTIDTEYPFHDKGHVKLSIKGNSALKLSISLRLPGWCKHPLYKINGSPVSPNIKDGFANFESEWKDEDTISFCYQMEIRLEQHPLNAVSVYRGPLLYSLNIDEKWEAYNKIEVDGNDFSEYEVFSNNKWNMALDLGNKPYLNSFKVKMRDIKRDPFAIKDSPISLIGKGQELPDWKMDEETWRAKEVPLGPVEPKGKYLDVELIPYALRNLHISIFPVLGSQIKNTINLNIILSGMKYDNTYGKSKEVIDSTEVELMVDKAGSYVLAIEYHNSNYRAASVLIGTAETEKVRVVFAPLFDMNKKDTASVTINLQKGKNLIKISAENWTVHLNKLTYTNNLL